MNKFVTTAIISICALGAQAQEIKGIEAGMTREQVQALFPDGFKGLTVAGIRSIYPNAKFVSYYNDKVLSFTFFFDPSDFETMRTAFKTKYPELTCTDSAVQNRMGATFTQTECVYKNLSLRRFTSSIDTSVVSLHDSEEFARRRAANSEKAKGDL